MMATKTEIDATAFPPLTRVACVGGGVIGGGWAARFLLAGIDVAVHDPHPEAERLVGAVIGNAEAAYARLTQAPLPEPGKLSFHASIEAAVRDADWVQESVPERRDVKRAVLGEIDAACPPGALIGSSTSGLLPSDLQEGLTRPQRLMVAHPYNPVYLLPLVEVVGGRQTDPRIIEKAVAHLRSIGMLGVPIRREIDAFVGDRLLEALWREALWLIRDDICDVETLDDVIRYSFGLRWAQMGLFQTYRIAGGEAGMRHFLGQFAPALSWPWSRLTDVVDLDETLIAKIVRQSDRQNEGLSTRALERIRDDNLVAILRALKGSDGGRGWGAGRLLAEFEAALRGGNEADATPPDPSKPLKLVRTRVAPEWIDYNGHMTEHRYLQVFADSTDALLRLIGVDKDYVASGQSYYTVETHIRHLGELKLGAPIHSTTQILSTDEKRIRVFHSLHASDAGRLVATAEQMLLHVDMSAGRAMPASAEIRDRLKALVDAHARLPIPQDAGRHIGAN
jgi:carnitine 3-dehydrogenase